MGHYVRNCPEIINKNRPMPYNRQFCNYCKKHGHIKDNCKKLAQFCNFCNKHGHNRDNCFKLYPYRKDNTNFQPNPFHTNRQQANAYNVDSQNNVRNGPAKAEHQHNPKNSQAALQNGQPQSTVYKARANASE